MSRILIELVLSPAASMPFLHHVSVQNKPIQIQNGNIAIRVKGYLCCTLQYTSKRMEDGHPPLEPGLLTNLGSDHELAQTMN